MDSAFSSSPVTELSDWISDNIILYAKWKPIEYSIIYNLNGGLNSEDNPSSYTVESTPVLLKNPSKEGYLFSGWYTDENFETIFLFDTSSVGNIELWAKWILNQITYTVEHLKWDFESNTYYSAEIELKSDKYGAYTSAEANVYDGYEALDFTQDLINEDGSTIIKIYYVNRHEKFWLHRVNHPEMLTSYYDYYSGFEMDIIFHSEEGDYKYKFENSHDIDLSTWYGLDVQFSTLKDLGFANSSKVLWLDFKNLNEDNWEKSMEVLENLVDTYGFSEKKDDIIVESNNWVYLNIFSQSGYKTSYYFPYYDFSSMSDEELQSAKDILTEALNSGYIDMVSFCSSYYDFVIENCGSSVKMLTWVDGVRWPNVVISDSYKQIINDDRIFGILVSDKKWR